MSEWKITRVSQMAEILSGGTPKTEVEEYWNGNIPWLSVKDFAGDTRKVYASEKHISELGLNNSATQLLHPGDIIISARGTVGEVAQIGKTAAFNQSCYGLRATDGYSSDYLYYMLKYQVRYLKSVANGAVFDTIVVKTFDRMKASVPDLPTQARIADILSAYDDLIEDNNHRITLLEKAAQELNKEWFVRFRFPGYETAKFENGIPVGWERTTFEKIASFQNGYAFKSEELLGSSEDDTYEVFKQGHIMRGGGFKAEGTKSWYPKSKCADLNKFVLHKNDILMAMTDMKDNVAILGNTALLPHDNRYILNQRVGLLRPTNYRKVGFAYIYLLTNSYDFVNDLRSRANRGVQVNLSAAQIRSSATVVPSEEINEKFEQIINPIFEEVFNILNQNENLIKQRDLLLPRLMSGKLEV